MDCSLSSLIEASKCYRCIPGPVMQASAISLLCQWANNLNPPCEDVSWAPATSVASWIDSGGAHSGNLAAFLASPNHLTTTSIDLHSSSLTSITCLRVLPLLSILYIDDNAVSSLDVTQNLALTQLRANFNNLTSIDVSNNTLLTRLEVGANQLTSIDVSSNVLLTFLDVGGQPIPSLDVSIFPSLGTLICQLTNITSIDLSSNPLMQFLTCWSNGLTFLDIGPSSGYIMVDAHDNLLPNVPNGVNDVFTKLEANCLANAGTVDLDTALTNDPPSGSAITSATNLSSAGWSVSYNFGPLWTPTTEVCNWVDSGGPNSGDWSTFQASADLPTVTSMAFAGGGLTSLTFLEHVPALTDLNVSGNASLTTLTLTGCTALVTLDCSSCDITGILDITDLPAIVESINAANNTNLTQFNAPNIVTANTTIVFSGCSGMTTFTAPQLTSVINGPFMLDGTTNLLSVSLPSFLSTPVAQFNISTSGVSTINLPLFFDHFGVQFHDNPNLVTCSIPSLASGGDTVVISNNPNLTTLTMTDFIGGSAVDLSGNTSLNSISLPNMVNPSGVTMSGCTILASFSAPNWIMVDGELFSWNGCALPGSPNGIDAILATGVASVLTASTLDFSGGTNLSHALWSVGALADESTLTTAGCTVLSNP